MNNFRIFAVLSLIGFATSCGGPGDDAEVPTAEPAGATMKDIGHHVVHFSALTTDQLPAEVARAYDIVRSPDSAMLTVSIISEEDNSSVPADVIVKVVNLTGQLKNVTMRRINEQDAIYYIGATSVAHRETLIFDIAVTPEDAQNPSEIRFKREFFTNTLTD